MLFTTAPTTKSPGIVRTTSEGPIPNSPLPYSGLDAVGKTLNDKYVHRPKIFSENTELSIGGILTEQAIAKAIAFEIKKSRQLCQSKLNIVFLNKADTLDQKASGLNITNLLKTDTIINKIITASLKDNVVITN